MTNWYSLAVPAIVAVLMALVPVVFRLSNRLALADERIERLTAALEEEHRRNDAQDQRQTSIEVAFAKIDGKLDQLRQMLEHRYTP